MGAQSAGTATIDPALAALATAHGVATEYVGSTGRPETVTASTVVAVLGALGVAADTPEAVAKSLADAELTPWRRLLPPTVVVPADEPATVVVRSPAGGSLSARVLTEQGPSVTATASVDVTEARTVDGVQREARTVALPALPPGWHRLEVSTGAETGEAVLIAAPARVPYPAGAGRVWGWMLQLYALRGADSWGIGDYGDLRELVRWSGTELSAGAVVCNPLHAPSPVLPLENSPYYPSSRRFRSPLYLRIADTAEYRAASPEQRAAVDALRPEAPADRIVRDPVWTAKLAALELLFPLAASGDRATALTGYRAEQGQGLEDFATFCALAEELGVPWQSWPAELHHPAADAVAAARHRLADRVDFHAWLQFLCDEQLAAVGDAAREAGMPVGVVHDLAVGVDPGGADAWGLQDVLADGATTGAPPDSFNQHGQNWELPPWNPRRLAEAGYGPYRDMLRATLRSAGGVRIDHVLGLFRLWWVPAGRPATEGTYVRYDPDAFLGVLALEAHRAGALVVGEDLGTVEPHVATALAARDVLGSNVIWFERDDPDPAVDAPGELPSRPRPPATWREGAAASVTTHDLPTAAGFLTGEHVRVRAELGVLGRSVEEETATAVSERAALLDLIRSEGLLTEPDGSGEETIRALHALLVRTPCRLVLAAPGDAVGDLRQPNLPGTTDEYPNWRLPLAVPGDAPGEHRPVTLEEFRASDRVRRFAEVLAGVRAR
ncbi:4-alpha-glucanotransferase [Cryptosporangium aurantiacum]|uniref:4-alpha-glucanotransferase n=1 Tax=Cryptosporangium aurantiacum TaxID=134849 RepID=A0A1M7RN05_9ACTN|nr:4-alpha-glucanotransferase [Cryptosporangium aurantiacum]SHN47452.1 4-alpha-glucanotransferase [Cryptosporangium aurantiacum]